MITESPGFSRENRTSALCSGPIKDDCLRLADSVEKIELSDSLNSGIALSGEPTHHIELFLRPSLTFIALLLGWFEVFC